MTEELKRLPVKMGTVVSTSMDKTIVVKVSRLVKHPLYKKYVKRFTKLKAHDANEEAKMGDVVQVHFTRPLSKTKRWRLNRIIKRSGE
ncbi:MAG: 30S ribosomal protein S17 [Planctomycetes bacterium]|nr:30S ribosomal protein S17 [Planctomycetota bacterium]